MLVQSQQLRRESSNIGPLAELDHWRRQLTTFTSIIEHIKSEPAMMYIHTLITAKSKLLKVSILIIAKFGTKANGVTLNWFI